MTRLHIVDYAMSDPAAARLVEEVVNRMPEPDYRIGIVSYGEALSRYADLAGRLARPVELIETPALGHRFAIAQGQDAQFAGRITHEVLADSFAAADLLWFPWVHDHLFASASMVKAVASFHDSAPVEMAEFTAERSSPAESATCTAMAAMADNTNRRLMRSLAGVAAGSQRLADHLVDHYAPKFRRPRPVPLPTPSLLAEEALPLTLPASPYLLSVGGIAPAGNHESLLRGLALLKRDGSPLVLALAGEGTDRIASGKDYREAYLRGLIDHLGLEIGVDLHLLGPLTPGALKSAFQGAIGAVLPALCEGAAMHAGAQALELGLPLASVDVPGVPGYFARRSAAPLWFSPGDAGQIAATLKRLALAPRGKAGPLPDTSWDQVAASYLTLFREQAILASTQIGGG